VIVTRERPQKPASASALEVDGLQPPAQPPILLLPPCQPSPPLRQPSPQKLLRSADGGGGGALA
jgi:hypothetical protein